MGSWYIINPTQAGLGQGQVMDGQPMGWPGWVKERTAANHGISKRDAAL